MTSLKKIAATHAALISGNLRVQAELREAELRRIAAEAAAKARPYLNVLAAQITNDEIEDQLNGDMTILRSKRVEIPLPAEIDEVCTAVMLPISFGDFYSAGSLIKLAELCESQLYHRLNELTAAGYRYEIVGFASGNDAALCIWPPC